uniref:Uncharacterized protein n=1 Tax=Timema genevievae TaxID=629358 RepID=A0A7R9K2D5_TIMGE|nr:unnamed protein product [Timema genevievae]
MSSLSSTQHGYGSGSLRSYLGFGLGHTFRTTLCGKPDRLIPQSASREDDCKERGSTTPLGALGLLSRPSSEDGVDKDSSDTGCCRKPALQEDLPHRCTGHKSLLAVMLLLFTVPDSYATLSPRAPNFQYFERPKYRYPYYDESGRGKLLYGYGGKELFQYRSYSPLEGIH